MRIPGWVGCVLMGVRVKPDPIKAADNPAFLPPNIQSRVIYHRMQPLNAQGYRLDPAFFAIT